MAEETRPIFFDGEYYDSQADVPVPDVSGIKTYTNVLQDSESTAPTSKALYDAVSGINSEVEKKAKSSDVGNISELSTTDKSSAVAAINEINDSLVGIESALDDKADKAELNAIPLLYNQNTDILAYALTCPQAKRTLVRIHSANATNNPFGVTDDTDFIYEISKIDSDSLWISIKAKDVRTNREFLNTSNDAIWLGWKEIATMDKVPVKTTKSYTPDTNGYIMLNVKSENLINVFCIDTGSELRVEILSKYNGWAYVKVYEGDTLVKSAVTLSVITMAQDCPLNVPKVEIHNPPKYKLGGLSFSASGTTLSITDGTNTWTLEANS